MAPIKDLIASNSNSINPADALLGEQPKSPVTDHFIGTIAAAGGNILQADALATLLDQGIPASDRAAIAAALMNQHRTTNP